MNKSDMLNVRIRPLLKELLPMAVKGRGLMNPCELVRLLIVKELVDQGLMPPMTETEKRDLAG